MSDCKTQNSAAGDFIFLCLFITVIGVIVMSMVAQERYERVTGESVEWSAMPWNWPDKPTPEQYENYRRAIQGNAPGPSTQPEVKP